MGSTSPQWTAPSPVVSAALNHPVWPSCSWTAAVTASPATHRGPSGRRHASRLPGQCHPAHAAGTERATCRDSKGIRTGLPAHVPRTMSSPSLGRRDSSPSTDRPSCFIPLFHRVLMVRWQLGQRTCCWGHLQKGSPRCPLGTLGGHPGSGLLQDGSQAFLPSPQPFRLGARGGGGMGGSAPAPQMALSPQRWVTSEPGHQEAWKPRARRRGDLQARGLRS